MPAEAKRSRDRGRKKKKARCALKVCRNCPALCCHGLVMPINKPRAADDIFELKWKLQYETVRVYVRSHRWYLLIEGRCTCLTRDNLCRIYAKRPRRCREHNPPECERYGKFYDALITTPEELEAYLARRKRR